MAAPTRRVSNRVHVDDHDDHLNNRKQFQPGCFQKGCGCFSFLFSNAPEIEEVDALFIGGGMVSATCATMLKELNPTWKIHIYEGLERCGTESSDGFNNAGTGHSGLCELNYTAESKDASGNVQVNIDKAVMINHQFQETREYLSYLKENNVIDNTEFINPAPHMSLCFGDDGVKFLKERHRKLSAHPLFQHQKYTEDPKQVAQWAPLLMKGRTGNDKVAATYSPEGTDVDFGSLTRTLVAGFIKKKGEVFCNHTVTKCDKQADGTWLVKVTTGDMAYGYKLVKAKWVCVGAGGMALTMLRKAGVEEVRGYGAFPISGQWLVCQTPEVANQHKTKVYGQASVGAPPMSVPHLDARIIEGKTYTLFGPYAGWSPRFLKSGSLSDWFLSVLSVDGIKALLPMSCAGLKNIDLVAYLIGELTSNNKQMMASLLRYYPEANPDEWTLITAGQRVCIMKPIADKNAPEGTPGSLLTGFLQFGTEVVTNKDKTITGLLGASPGASTTTTIALNVLEKCFPDKMQGWMPTIKKMVPSYNPEKPGGFDTDAAVAGQHRTAKILGLPEPGYCSILGWMKSIL